MIFSLQSSGNLVSLSTETRKTCEKKFVSHEGKKLEIRAMGTRHTVDIGDPARQMTDLIEQNVVDPELRRLCLYTYEDPIGQINVRDHDDSDVEGVLFNVRL